MDLWASHNGFVFAAYGLSVLVLAVTIGLNVVRARAMARRLSELEGRQAPRRRAAGPGAGA